MSLLKISRIEALVINLIFVMSLMLLLMYCYYQSYYFGSYPYDGPFQTLYSLRKIAAGYYPGRDFYFFHGNGIPYVHYPIYALFGKTVFASHFAEALIHILSIYAPMYFVLFRYYGEKVAMIGCVGWTVLSGLSFYGLPLLSSLSAFQPLSTFGIRTVMTLVISYLIADLFSRGESLKGVLQLGVGILLLTPITFILGTEHGIYTIAVLYASIFAGSIYKKGFTGVLIGVGFSVASICMILLFHLIAFGNFSAFDELKNLIGDQSWYFGTYPHLFLIDLSDIANMQHGQLVAYRYLLLITVSLGLIFYYLAAKRFVDFRNVLFVTFLLIESLIGLSSNFGYVSYHYAAPLLRVDFFIFIFITMSFVAPKKSSFLSESAIK